jgi:gluconate kinase
MINESNEYLPPGILFINGVPGSGKTTVARMIATDSPKGAHIDGDEIHNLVVGGRIHPPGKPEDEVERQLMLRFRNMALLADSFYQCGFFPVLETCISTRRYLGYLLSHITSSPVAMVVLLPSPAIARERDNQRLEKTIAHLHTSRYDEIKEELCGTGLVIDNSRMTPEETKNEILDKAFTEGIIRR